MLRLHRAERSSTLAAGLATVLASPLADPFTPEIVAVPAKGVERWLNQRLSTVLGAVDTDGVAANIEFPSPTHLVDQAIAAASGFDADDDPWSQSRLLWSILAVIDECLDEPWCGVLATHLGRGEENFRVGRRYDTAAHIADLFRSYGAQRPAMFIDWAQGRDTDGAGSSVPADLAWQPQLWRRVHERIGASPAQRLDRSCERLRDEPDVVDLPGRLSLFGPTRLTSTQLTVLSALAVKRDVHLWLPHPSPRLWGQVAAWPQVSRRAEDDSAVSIANPLLASLSRDVREVQMRLGELVDVDEHHDGTHTPGTLLAALQSDIRDDRTPSATSSLDGTVEIHACHGAPRQVEVLRDCLLHLFAADPTLEPRDVLVMCPDVETFAPLVRAAFGQGVLEHPGHRLRVSLADRALSQTNPLLETVATLLQLADGRVTSSQLLDLAATAPVRKHFRFTDENLERLRDWASESGARWGIDERQRDAFGLAAFAQNTITTGLDRILLGVAADETEIAWLDRSLPLDDVDSNDIDLAGRFTEFVDRVAAVLARLTGKLPAQAWTVALTDALDLLTAVSTTDEWQLTQAKRELGVATEHSSGLELRLPDVRAMLADRLAGQPTRANFRTGDLTVATLVPMRSVPHRVVVLLGLDDEVFPRGAGFDGDDITARDPLIGERDPRSEDRQLLLDAVMSAGERLVVLYSGADPVSGATRPPAVPLAELIDVIVATTGADVTDVVRRHPLQPFDPLNFLAANPFGFDTAALAGASASQLTPTPAPPFLPGALPDRHTDVELKALTDFLVNPTQGFLWQRLGVRVRSEDEGVVDALNPELDSLAKWSIGDRLLAARLAGGEMDVLRAAEWRRGTLPPHRLGSVVLDDITRTVDAIAAAAKPVHAGTPETIDVAIDLGDGRQLTGTVSGIYDDVVATTVYSQLKPKHRLEAWVALLALTVARPRPWRAITTGRGRRNQLQRSTLLSPADAHEQLRRLVDLRDRGLTAPLPMAIGATATYAQRRFSGANAEDALDAAAAEWASKFGDCTDRHVAYLYRPPTEFATFAADEPRDDERAWANDPTRFGVLAARLWAPILRAETVGTP